MKTKIPFCSTIKTTGILLVLLASCKSRSIQTQNIGQLETPPGLIKMRSNFFVDQTEITNFSYLEFAWWTRQVYGKNSEEYQAIYPDSSSWTEFGNNSLPFFKYFHDPAYRDFPVVCINYDQAKKFTKWRSDRVMEFMLIREGIIHHHPHPHKDSIFTIEKYFTGKYNHITPHPNISYYPDCQLPDTAIYTQLLSFADSLNSKNNSNCKNYKHCGQEIFTCNCKENKNKFYTPGHLQSTTCSKCKKPLIVHLRGNALELTNTPGIGFGGSFNIPCAILSKQHFYAIDKTIFDVGFRNTCVWRKWH